MTDRWHRTKDLVGLVGMPRAARPIRTHGARRGWVSREVPWGNRIVLEWLETSLPEQTQAALREQRGEEAPVEMHTICIPVGGPVAVMDARTEILAAFERWRPKGSALVPALKEWCALYTESGAGVSAETRKAIPTVAWNTVQRWRTARRNSGSDALRTNHRGSVSGIEADEQLHAKVAAMLYANPHHVTAKNILRALRAEFPGRELPSVSTVRRFARKWRAEHEYEISAVADPDGHRSRTMPAFGSESEAVQALNQLWELDSTRIDVMCADGKRYSLVAAIDVWSRRAKALVVPESCASAIGLLIRRCLLDWGAPAWIKTDEGADYT